MNIIFLGAPGSGKGTQGEKLAKHFDYQLLTTSTLLRQSSQLGDVLGAQIKADMAAGKLVSDALVWQVLARALAQSRDAGQSVCLDGYPRSLPQLAFLREDAHRYDYLFYFEVSDAVVTERICGRRVHLPSGRVYHETYAPPKVPGHDDVTGEPLVHRPDDSLAVVTQRLETYREKTLPILDAVHADIRSGQGAIKSVVTLNADQPIDVVTAELVALLGLNDTLIS